jgi:hypothetical protein
MPCAPVMQLDYVLSHDNGYFYTIVLDVKSVSWLEEQQLMKILLHVK